MEDIRYVHLNDHPDCLESVLRMMWNGDYKMIGIDSFETFKEKYDILDFRIDRFMDLHLLVLHLL